MTVQFIDRSQIPQQFTQLSLLDIIVFFFLPNFLQQQLPKLLLQKHLMQTNQNLQYMHNDLRLSITKPNPVLNLQILRQHLRTM